MRSSIVSAVVLALAALPSTLAAPSRPIQPAKFFGCPIAAAPDFPADQTTLVIQSGLKPKFVGLGVGVQNYTCGAAGTFTSAGAIAQLFDVSCLVNTGLFSALPNMAYAAATSAIAKQLRGGPFKLGDHYFITNAAGGISPTFDFTASQKNSTAFVTAAKKGAIPSPAGPSNIDWLMLSSVDGSLSQQVFRVDTKAGQPAASCTQGDTTSVPYTAMYWFYG